MDRDIHWKQYEQHIGTFKFYLELVVKIVSFYFAITGAMLSFHFSNISNENSKLALYLPFLMGSGLLILFIIGAVLSLITRNDVFALRDELELKVAPETGILTGLLVVFSIVLAITLAGLGHLLWC